MNVQGLHKKYGTEKFIQIVKDLVNVELSNADIANAHGVTRAAVSLWRNGLCEETKTYKIRPEYKQYVETICQTILP